MSSTAGGTIDVSPAAHPPAVGSPGPTQRRPRDPMTPSDRARVERLRDEFPIVRERTYLFSGGIAPAPRRASDAVAEWVGLWSRDPAAVWQRRFEASEVARERLARLLGVPSRTIALTDGTSRACNLAVALLDPPAGANVVVDATTYPSCLYPWLPPVRTGLEVRRAASGLAGLGAGAADVEARLDDRTVAVSVSHVAPETGFRHDLRALAEVAHAAGAVLVADIAQSAGIVPLDLVGDGVDLAAGTAMKWLLGPPGIGYLYVSESLLARTGAPHVGYAHARLDPDDGEHVLLDPDARRHELGLPSLLVMPGFAAALEVIEEVGVPAIQAHVGGSRRTTHGRPRPARPARHHADRSPAPRGGSSAVPAREPSRVAAYLRDRRVDVWGSDKRGLIRIDPHAFNDTADIDRCIDALAACQASDGAAPFQPPRHEAGPPGQ